MRRIVPIPVPRPSALGNLGLRAFQKFLALKKWKATDFEVALAFPLFFSVWSARHAGLDGVDCEFCDGDGFIVDDWNWKCTVCRGRGWVHGVWREEFDEHYAIRAVQGKLVVMEFTSGAPILPKDLERRGYVPLPGTDNFWLFSGVEAVRVAKQRRTRW